MPKRKSATKTYRPYDIKSWNFILFLALAFVLLVVMLNAMGNVVLDVRTKAGLSCPTVTIPRAEDCPEGWTYHRDPTNGCPTFVCDPEKEDY